MAHRSDMALQLTRGLCRDEDRLDPEIDLAVTMSAYVLQWIALDLKFRSADRTVGLFVGVALHLLRPPVPGGTGFRG